MSINGKINQVDFNINKMVMALKHNTKYVPVFVFGLLSIILYSRLHTASHRDLSR